MQKIKMARVWNPPILIYRHGDLADKLSDNRRSENLKKRWGNEAVKVFSNVDELIDEMVKCKETNSERPILYTDLVLKENESESNLELWQKLSSLDDASQPQIIIISLTSGSDLLDQVELKQKIPSNTHAFLFHNKKGIDASHQQRKDLLAAHRVLIANEIDVMDLLESLLKAGAISEEEAQTLTKMTAGSRAEKARKLLDIIQSKGSKEICSFVIALKALYSELYGATVKGEPDPTKVLTAIQQSGEHTAERIHQLGLSLEKDDSCKFYEWNTDVDSKGEHSDKGFQDLPPDDLRWVSFGIALHKVLVPLLQSTVRDQLGVLWQQLKDTHDISKQTNTSHLKRHPENGTGYNLQYKNINDNHTKAKDEEYNYQIQSPLDLAKLFLKPEMAKVDDFKSLSTDAVSQITKHVGAPFVKIQPAAEKIWHHRNKWGHCDTHHWTMGTFDEVFNDIENILKDVEQVNPKVWEEMNRWREIGLLADIKTIQPSLKDILVTGINELIVILKEDGSQNVEDKLKTILETLEFKPKSDTEKDGSTDTTDGDARRAGHRSESTAGQERVSPRPGTSDRDNQPTSTQQNTARPEREDIFDRATTAQGFMNIVGTLGSVGFKMIESKQFTSYDFECFLRDKVKANQLSIRVLKDEKEATVLHAAAEKNRLSFLGVIHRLGYWDDLRDLKMPTGPGACADRDGKEIAERVAKSRKLVKEFDEINLWEKSMNSLHKAARAGDMKEVKEVIKNRPSLINEKDYMECNSLYWACVNGDIKIVRELYKAGARPDNINKKGESILHIACIVGHSHLIQLLVKDYKVPVDLKDKAGRTALLYTADNGDIKTLKELMVCRVTLVPDLVPLCAFAGRKIYLQFLIEDQKMNIHLKDENNKTAFLRAAEGGKKQILEYIFEKAASDPGKYGIKWDDVDKRQRGIFHLAVEGAAIDVIELLVKKASDSSVTLLQNLLNAQDIYVGAELCFLIRGKDKGRQAWHYVEVKRNMVHMFTTKTKSGSVDVALYGAVVKSGWGTDPEDSVMEELENRLKQRTEALNPPGDVTALHMACFKEHERIAKVLLQSGADPNIRDSFGLTPLHVACMRGNIKLIEALEEHGADASVMSHDGKSPLQVAEDNDHSNVVHFIKGRSFFSRTEEFLRCMHVKLPQFSQDHLERLRGEGRDVRRHLIDALRDMSIDINQFLLDIGSGPVLEESSPFAR